MTTQNWPDPKRPGVPLFPERDGWHVIDARSGGSTVLAYWNGKEWGAGDCVRALNSSPEWWRYNGAVLTPAQINEMLAAERERAAKAAQEVSDTYYEQRQESESDNERIYADERMFAAQECVEAIRNLGAAP